jgi:hypothetical protein
MGRDRYGESEQLDKRPLGERLSAKVLTSLGKLWKVLLTEGATCPLLAQAGRILGEVQALTFMSVNERSRSKLIIRICWFHLVSPTSPGFLEVPYKATCCLCHSIYIKRRTL